MDNLEGKMLALTEVSLEDLSKTINCLRGMLAVHIGIGEGISKRTIALKAEKIEHDAEMKKVADLLLIELNRKKDMGYELDYGEEKALDFVTEKLN